MKKESVCLNCEKKIVYDDTQKRGKWCSSKCFSEYKENDYINKWKMGKVDGGKEYTSRYIRRYLLEKNNLACSKCGWKEINPTTNKCPLHIDHINGNHLDNSEKNLRVLCPNCHSLTENYGILNKGKGRYSFGNKKHPKYRHRG